MVGAKIEVQSMILVFEVDPNKSLPLNNIVFFFFKKKGKCISEHSKHDSLRKMWYLQSF